MHRKPRSAGSLSKSSAASQAGPASPGTSSSRKVLGLLWHFRPDRPTAAVDNLAKAIGVPRSSAYRYLALLREMGFVGVRADGSYHLSSRVVEMSHTARAANTYLQVAMPFMRALRDATSETVLLVQRIGDSAVCIGKADSSHPVRLSYEDASALPLHRGAAPGKILWSYMSLRERRGYMDRATRQGVDLGQGGALPGPQELQQILEHGVAHADSEIVPDVRGVAVPVFEAGKLVAALCIAGPAYRLTSELAQRIQAELRSTAAALGRELTPLRLPQS